MSAQKPLFLHCVRELIHFRSAFDAVPAREANWFIERLNWHKLLPFAAAVSEHQHSKLQSDVLSNAFTQASLRNLAAEENYFRQCQWLWNLFTEHDIAFLAYKGPFWGSQVYPAYHFRHIGDIDILMPQQHAEKSYELLVQHGYVAEVLGQTAADDFATRGELTLHADTNAPHLTSIQLHWHLMPAPRFLKKRYIENDDFNHHSRQANWRGLEYTLPSVEARFLYLALHATCQHQFNRLILIVEMAMLLAHAEEINWTTVFSLARRRNAVKTLYYALNMLHHICPLPPPAMLFLQQTAISIGTQLLCAPMSINAIIDFNAKTGRRRRKLFRRAMS